MRQLLLHLVVLGVCALGLLNPLTGLYGYIWYSLMRPDVLAWSEGMFPHSMTLAIITLLGVWRFVPNVQFWLKNPFVQLLLLLQVPILLSIAMAPVPMLAWEPYARFLRILAMCLIIPLYIQTENDFRRLVLLMVGCLMFIGVKYGAYGVRMGGVHLNDGYGGFMSDNNTLSMALVMMLPMGWYARSLVSQRWAQLVLLGGCFFTIVAIVMSHSRAAALTLGLVYLMIAARSKYKLLTLAVIVLLSFPAVYLVQDSFKARLKTLENPEEEGSAASRIEYAKAAVRLWQDYPVFGVGYGTQNWVRMSGNYLGYANMKRHVVHNNYLQMLVDSGTPALLVLLAQLWGGIWWLGRSARRMKILFPGENKEAYPIMLQVSLIAFSFCSLFASRTDYDYYYYLIMCCGCWWIVEKNELLPLAAARAARAAGPAEAQAQAPSMVNTWQPVAVIGPARTLRDADPAVTGPIPKGWRRPFQSQRLAKEAEEAGTGSVDGPPTRSQRNEKKL